MSNISNYKHLIKTFPERIENEKKSKNKDEKDDSFSFYSTTTKKSYRRLDSQVVKRAKSHRR